MTTVTMALIKLSDWPLDVQFDIHEATFSAHGQQRKVMDLSDSLSSTSSSPQPPPSQTKIGAKRGRPRLTEDAEQAKLVSMRN